MRKIKSGSKYIGKFKSHQMFGDWSVLKSDVYMDKRGRTFVKCQCVCKKEELVSCHHLLKGRSTRCKECNNSYRGRGISSNPNWKGEGMVPQSILTSLSQSVITKGIEYNLNATYMNELYERSGQTCAFTNLPISTIQNTAKIARLRHDSGYVPGNVAWVHTSIEPVLRKTSANDFIAMCVAVAEKYKPTTKGFKNGN